MTRRIFKHSFSLLHVDYVKLNQKWNYKNVISPYFRLYYISEGQGFVSDGSGNTLLEPGYLYLIPSFTLFNVCCGDALSQYFIQFFEESADGFSLFAGSRTAKKLAAEEYDIHSFKRILAINPGRGINRSDNPKVYEKDIFYKEYQALNNLQSRASYFETQGIILQLLARFLSPETCAHADIFNPAPSKVINATNYIQVNLQKKLNVSLLAEMSNLNSDYFSRLFKRYTGERPLDYIHTKRIERAQYLITITNMTYAEVASETGFESFPYFSTMFKRITGMTPVEYKNKSKTVN